ncbi:MAG: hypothetical protein KIG15_01650 [Coriobacteriales bacterium]|nr:hypothetical protein [Coriobacteriales bacterium]
MAAARSALLTAMLPIPTCCNCGTTSARRWVELDGGRWACGPCWNPFKETLP